MDAKGKNKMVKVVKKEAAAFVDSDGDREYEYCMQEEEEEEEEEEEDDDDDNNSNKKKKGIVLKKGSSGGGGWGGGGGGGGGGGSGMRKCQAEKCMADLVDAKQYHRRHKVCEVHAKAQVVLVGGIRQRFCQQCSRFHELSEFDETKRSCRRRLAGHNQRRRKNMAESNREGSSSKGTSTQLKDIVSGQVDDKGRIKLSVDENATYKHFQIR